MSILIKGMEMPESCSNCELCACYAESKGYVYRCDITMYPVKYFEKRLDNCPLVEVQLHGRLIDADELIEKQKEDAEIFMGSTNYGDKARYDEAMNAVANIVNAQTIIPADKDGEMD